jgi:hypothetical protein
VEAGFLSKGTGNIGGITDVGNFTFWADLRPGSAYFAHEITTSPSLNSTFVSIYRSGSSTFTAEVGSQQRNSISNTMVPQEGIWGSETNADSGVHSFDLNTDMEYETGGGWHDGTGGVSFTRANAPETYSWITNYTEAYAGVSC